MASANCKKCGRALTSVSSLKLCPCKLADALSYNATSQTSDRKDHKNECEPAQKSETNAGGASSSGPSASNPSIVKAVDLTGGFNTPFHPVEVDISSDHAMFDGAGVLSPISKIIGRPLLIYRHLRDNAIDYQDHPDRANFDNQSVTYMMIDPVSGFASSAWQCGIGRVTVARQDKKPLTKAELETFWMYCDRIIEYFGNGDGPPFFDYTPAAYAEWEGEYKERMKESAEEWERIKSTDWGPLWNQRQAV